MTDKLFSPIELRELAAFAIKELGTRPNIVPDNDVLRALNTGMLVSQLYRYSCDQISSEGLASTHLTLDGNSARQLATRFLGAFFDNVRSVICAKKGRRRAETANLSTEGVATAIASTVVTDLGTNNATAIAVTTLVLIVIGDVPGESFCETAQDDLLGTL